MRIKSYFSQVCWESDVIFSLNRFVWWQQMTKRSTCICRWIFRWIMLRTKRISSWLRGCRKLSAGLSPWPRGGGRRQSPSSPSEPQRDREEETRQDEHLYQRAEFHDSYLQGKPWCLEKLEPEAKPEIWRENKMLLPYVHQNYCSPSH